MGKLTTVIPVYNGERYLLETLRCVASQTRPPERLVVLDNCSTDATKQIVQEFAKGFACEWQQNERNIGLFGNMNRALEFADQTDYLHILTADDLILPEFYAKVLGALEPLHGKALGFSRFELVDGEGKKLPPWWYINYRDNDGRSRPIALDTFLDNQSQMTTILLPAVILKTCREPAACQFRPELPMHADAVFLAEWAKHSQQVVEVRQILAQYRVHSQNETRKLEAQLDTMTLQEWNAMEAIMALRSRPYLGQLVYRQKMKCLFAARLCVGIKRLQPTQPEIAPLVKARTGEILSPLHWTAARLAVTLRDIMNGVRRKMSDKK